MATIVSIDFPETAAKPNKEVIHHLMYNAIVRPSMIVRNITGRITTRNKNRTSAFRITERAHPIVIEKIAEI